MPRVLPAEFIDAFGSTDGEKMRRAEKEISDPKEIEAILQASPVCRIAMAADNRPYMVAVNFVSTSTHLYFHTALSGRKIDLLRKNSSVCFEVDLPGDLVQGKTACSWGMAYKSVIGFGRAYFIEGVQEKKKTLDLLMNKFAGEGFYDYSDDALDKVCVIGIKIEQISGKKSG